MNKTNFDYDDNFCPNKLTFENTFCNLCQNSFVFMITVFEKIKYNIFH